MSQHIEEGGKTIKSKEQTQIHQHEQQNNIDLKHL